MIHLDTNFMISALRGAAKEDASVRRWLADAEPMAMSAIAWAELLCGPIPLPAVDAARNLLSRIDDFTAADAALAASLFGVGGRRRHSFPDCMIAACAIRLDASLATNNLADFRRFQPFGLRLLTA